MGIKQDLINAINYIDTNPRDPERVIQALQLALRARDKGTFLTLSDSYQQLIPESEELLFVMADGLTRLGFPIRALELIEQYPDSHDHPGIAALLTKLKKKAAKSAVQNKPLSDAGRKKISSMMLFRLVAAGIALLIGGIFGITRDGSTSNNARYTAWLVNGLQVPYVVELDGEVHNLDAFEQKYISLEHGEYEAVMTIEGLPTETVVFTVDRGKGRDLPVINLDGCATFFTDYTWYYSENYGEEEEFYPTLEYFPWQQVHYFSDIDFAFVDFPDQIETSGNSQKTRMNRVSALAVSSYVSVTNMLPEYTEPSMYGEFARRVLTYHPLTTEAPFLLSILENVGDGDDFIRAGLEVYPPQIEWHRYYQNAEELLGNEAELLETYRSRLETYPDSGAYAYLLGRVTDDEADAVQLFLQSEKIGGIGGLGYNAIAYNYLSTGQFDRVLEYAAKAFELNPDHPVIYSIYMTALEAVGRYDELLEFALTRLSFGPDDVYAVQSTLYNGILAGRDDLAQDAVDRYFDISSEWMSDENRDYWEFHFDAVEAYTRGNLGAYYDLEKSAGFKSFDRHLFEGDPVAAWEQLKVTEMVNDVQLLTMYCAAGFHGQKDLQDTVMESLMMDLQDTQILRILKDPAITPGKLRRESLMPADKRLVAAALGFRDSAYRDDYFEISQAHNFEIFFPKYLLEIYTAGGSY